MTFPDRLALERKTLKELISKYPLEHEPYTKLRDLLHQYVPNEYPKLRDGWIEMGKDLPNDPLVLLLASEALYGIDTPESIRLLQSARAEAPEFSWAARDLAGIYSDGKLADPAKAKENIDAFFAICPTSSDPYAQYPLPKADPLLQPKAIAARAVALRARLENLAPMKPRIGKRRAPTGSLSISLRKVEKDARHNLAMPDQRFSGPWLRPSSSTTTSVCSRIKHGDVRFLHLALAKGRRSPAHRHFYCWSFVSKEFLA